MGQLLATVASVQGGARALTFGGRSLGEGHVVARGRRTVTLRDVNPLTEGHVVVAPQRAAARVGDLDAEEYSELLVSAVEAMRRLSEPPVTAFNVALKDGPAAGQPVPHCHLHVVPRRPADLEENDLIYGMLDRWTPDGRANPHLEPLDVPADLSRRPRTAAEMAAESRELRAALDPEDRRLDLPDGGPVRFGPIPLDRDQLFFASDRSLALVNLKPLTQGHVLVIPRRVAPTLLDLHPDEAADLWEAARRVYAMVLRHYRATGANIAVQDGRDAGQSVPHVHIHILPRGHGSAVAAQGDDPAA